MSKVDYLIPEIRGHSDPLNPPRAPSLAPHHHKTKNKTKRKREISQFTTQSRTFLTHRKNGVLAASHRFPSIQTRSNPRKVPFPETRAHRLLSPFHFLRPQAQARRRHPPLQRRRGRQNVGHGGFQLRPGPG